MRLTITARGATRRPASQTTSVPVVPGPLLIWLGALAVLEDAERRVMGLVTVNPKSRIVARMLDRDAEATLDDGVLTLRVDLRPPDARG